MRDNTAKLNALPNLSFYTAKGYGKWAKLHYSSLPNMHRASCTYARTTNETIGQNSEHWLGLENQTRSSYEQTGICEYSLGLVKKNADAMAKHYSRLAEPHAAITGGYWDTPSVLANIPLAARTRKRSRLAPKSIKIGYFMSCSISAADMAVLAARISRAIWDYTIAGGAVTLTVAHVGRVTSSTGAVGLTVETLVNTSDVSAVATALSPAFFRIDGGCLMQAFSDHRSDSIGCPRTSPLPADYLYMGGAHGDSLKAAETIIKTLQITPDLGL